MVERWPHTITLTVKSEVSKDTKGNPIEGSELATLTTPARAKILGANQNTVLATNGDVMPTSHTISFPACNDDFSNGQVTWNNRLYSIVRFHKYQNRCKIWI